MYLYNYTVLVQIFEVRKFCYLADDVYAMEIKSLKLFYACIIIHKIRPVILQNEITKMLNLWNPRNIHTSLKDLYEYGILIPYRKIIQGFYFCGQNN